MDNVLFGVVEGNEKGEGCWKWKGSNEEVFFLHL